MNPVFVSSSELVTKDEAVKQLMSTTEGKKTYSVISGDTLSGIASENGISTKDLLSINPDLQISSTLKIGQVINLTVPHCCQLKLKDRLFSNVEAFFARDASSRRTIRDNGNRFFCD